MNGFEIVELTLNDVRVAIKAWDVALVQLRDLRAAGVVSYNPTVSQGISALEYLKHIERELLIRESGVRVIAAKSARGIEAVISYRLPPVGEAGRIRFLTTSPLNVMGSPYRIPGAGSTLVDAAFKDFLRVKVSHVGVMPGPGAEDFWIRIGFSPATGKIDEAGMAKFSRNLQSAHSVYEAKLPVVRGITVEGVTNPKAFSAVNRALTYAPDDLLRIANITRIVGFDAPGNELFRFVGDQLHVNQRLLEGVVAGKRSEMIRQAIGSRVWDNMTAAQKTAWADMFNAGVMKGTGSSPQATFANFFSRMNSGFTREANVMKNFPQVDGFFRETFPASYKTLTAGESMFREFFLGSSNIRSLSMTTNRAMIQQAEAMLARYFQQYGFGNQVGRIALRDPALLSQIHGEGLAGAQTAVRTFNQQLQAQIGAINERYAKMGIKLTQAQLRKEIGAWASKAFADKQQHVMNWQLQRTRTLMTKEFHSRSGVRGAEVWVVPDHQAVCDRCLNLIGGNPWRMPGDETASQRLVDLPEDPPLHVRCVHSIEIRSGIVADDTWPGRDDSGEAPLASVDRSIKPRLQYISGEERLGTWTKNYRAADGTYLQVYRVSWNGKYTLSRFTDAAMTQRITWAGGMDYPSFHKLMLQELGKQTRIAVPLPDIKVNKGVGIEGMSEKRARLLEQVRQAGPGVDKVFMQLPQDDRILAGLNEVKVVPRKEMIAAWNRISGAPATANVSAFYDGTTRTIWLAKNAAMQSDHFLHEFGHALSQMTGASKSAAWETTWQQAKSSLSQLVSHRLDTSIPGMLGQYDSMYAGFLMNAKYAMTNRVEGFAEMFMSYQIEPAKFREVFSGAASYFDQLLRSYGG